MKGKKILSAFIALVLIAGMPVTAFAADWNIAEGSITISATESGQNVSQDGGASMSDPNPVISGSSDTNTITIDAAKGATANVTLKDVSIDVGGDDGKANNVGISTRGDGNVTIELDGNNSVKSGGDHAGLEKNNGGNLTIKDDDNDGKLTAIGHGGAGIGGKSDCDVSNITIKGGTINASSTSRGAGIGGCGNGSASDITIEGGNITAEGAYGGAGIGSGQNRDASNIKITGGKVKATGGGNAAGIGGGMSGDGSDITISGGEVTAIGGLGGAGIGSGGGFGRNGSDITISGDAQVKVKGGSYDYKHNRLNEGAAIGNGGNKYSKGSEVEPDTSGLTVDGKIEYYEPNDDIDTAQPSKTTVGELPSTRPTPKPEQPAEPKAEAAIAPAPGESAPLYRVTDKDGKDLAYKYEKNNGVLTVTVEADYAVLTGSLAGINALSQQGIEELVFVTNGETSTYKLAELLDMGSLSDSYALTHDGATATLTVG